MTHRFLALEREAVVETLRDLGAGRTHGWVELAKLDDEAPFEAGVSRMTLEGLEAEGKVERDGPLVRATT